MISPIIFNDDMGFDNIKIVKEKRKTLQIKVNEDLSVVVKAPKGLSNEFIHSYIRSHEKWINKAVKEQEERNNSIVRLSDDEKRYYINKANDRFPSILDYYSKLMNIDYKDLKIKGLKSKWGSCNRDGNIILNYKLAMTNDDVIKYVVIHELAHRKYMNHSKKFYSFIEKYMPNYKESIQYLKKNGFMIMKAFE